MIAFAWFRKPQGDGAPRMPDNPLRLGAAIQMAVLFQIVLWVLEALRERLGSDGPGRQLGSPRPDRHGRSHLLAHRARAGSGAADGRWPGGRCRATETAARGLLVGMLANTVFKATVATALGANAFRLRVVAALAILGGRPRSRAALDLR